MAEPYFTFDDRLHPICQIGLSDIRQAEPTTWLDVSCYVHEAELFRGRERFNERFEPGTASVTFSNETGWADLGGTYTEVAAAELRPGRQIRIGVRGPWDNGPVQTRWLYRGYIDQATPAYDPTLHDVVTVNCIDALGEAGSSIAPTGDHQGVNETVSARLNRVLDAVGWWPAKRKIAATATTVQGTELGAAAIDHMSQAADSAGGVVFGDLDGDVVFKDIDWMLYDPDTPPDDGIGNGPGTGGPGLPPYIDPTPGPVYDPDDPPAENPPKVCVCADGTAGTLVEKGDNYRLYVRGGHLYYETSGRTWDLGPYSGGCTCVDPNPDGGGGIDDGGGPERTDDPEEDGTYEIVPPYLPELPPLFAVELLGWSDAGLADPPATGATISITPGIDCILVVLATGIGALTDTGGLAPTVTGGLHLDWAHHRGVDRGGGIASTHIIVAQVGRDDPGTFDVVVTWTPPATSRSHIVTVWKVVAAVDDYVARFDAGDVAHGLATSAPPEFLNPGDGPVTVTLATYNAPNVPKATRAFDICMAQSLAEEDTEPYGAVFDDTDGAWTVVPVTGGAGTPVFSDEFETDGGLSVVWVIPDAPPTAPGNQATRITTGLNFDALLGAAIGPQVETTEAAIMRWTGEIPGGQFIEATFTFPGVGTISNDEAVINFYLLLDDTDGFTAYGAQLLQKSASDGFRLRWFTWTSGFQSGLGSDYFHDFVDVTHTTTMRFEATPEGQVRALVDGVVVPDSVYDFTEGGTVTPPPFGARVGMSARFRPGAGGGADEPRIESVAFGPLVPGEIVRRTSWVSGWRWGSTASTVEFTDVNLGPSDYQSAQACLVLESAEVPIGFSEGPEGVWLGGVNDPWNGIIRSAVAGAAGGVIGLPPEPIWEFP